jgi:hypothetical protein
VIGPRVDSSWSFQKRQTMVHGGYMNLFVGWMSHSQDGPKFDFFLLLCQWLCGVGASASNRMAALQHLYRHIALYKDGVRS